MIYIYDQYVTHIILCLDACTASHSILETTFVHHKYSNIVKQAAIAQAHADYIGLHIYFVITATMNVLVALVQLCQPVERYIHIFVVNKGRI